MLVEFVSILILMMFQLCLNLHGVNVEFYLDFYDKLI